jgi:hypothetical protein
MVIRFLCPNGHKVHCPDSQAGRAAKCPQCGVKFQIPTASDADTTAAVRPGSDIGPGNSDASPSANFPNGISRSIPQSGIGSREPMIEFLCPNGHRLHGPASLQGRPGECPECGSRFRVPSYGDDLSDEEALDDQHIGRGHIGGGQDSNVGQAVSAAGLPADSETGYAVKIEDLNDGGLHGNAQASGAHPWLSVFPKLWVQKSLSGGVVEISLSDGDAIVPERFARAVSQRAHAVFAVKDSGGTLTITAVPWESIVRVHVRGLKKLPEDLFG